MAAPKAYSGEGGEEDVDLAWELLLVSGSPSAPQRQRKNQTMDCPRCGVSAFTDVSSCGACGWQLARPFDGQGRMPVPSPQSSFSSSVGQTFLSAGPPRNGKNEPLIQTAADAFALSPPVRQQRVTRPRRAARQQPWSGSGAPNSGAVAVLPPEARWEAPPRLEVIEAPLVQSAFDFSAADQEGERLAGGGGAPGGDAPALGLARRHSRRAGERRLLQFVRALEQPGVARPARPARLSAGRVCAGRALLRPVHAARRPHAGDAVLRPAPGDLRRQPAAAAGGAAAGLRLRGLDRVAAPRLPLGGGGRAAPRVARPHLPDLPHRPHQALKSGAPALP